MDFAYIVVNTLCTQLGRRRRRTKKRRGGEEEEEAEDAAAVVWTCSCPRSQFGRALELPCSSPKLHASLLQVKKWVVKNQTRHMSLCVLSRVCSHDLTCMCCHVCALERGRLLIHPCLVPLSTVWGLFDFLALIGRDILGRHACFGRRHGLYRCPALKMRRACMSLSR